MIDFVLEIEEEELLEELRALEWDVAKTMLYSMEQVGWETVGLLRSLTNETRPPARVGEPHRRAHPGGWADVSSNLANAYRFELYSDGKLVRWSTEGENPQLRGNLPSHPTFPLELKFLNGMEYALYLELRDGYWVIREVTEAGGPVQRALRKVLRAVAPDMDIRVL